MGGKVLKPKTLKLNDRGKEVTDAQTLLRRAGSTITLNGWFSIGMASAVKSFQKKHNLPVTGVVDRKTWTKLESYRKPRASTKSKGGK